MRENTENKLCGYIVFFNARHYLLELNGMERVLLEYLIEKSHDYWVTTRKERRSDFIAHVKSISIKEITDDQVVLGIDKLVKRKMLIPTTKQNNYYINPKYFRTTTNVKDHRNAFRRIKSFSLKQNNKGFDEKYWKEPECFGIKK